ncbi:hypothetical protein RJ640_023811 [Escallonia rubra]|uniref:Beta-glucosidase n=2 Tax=Escallonia rubra TaxID=112253 RepID=A0AA88R6Z8_9ASTE|nr:hypothetical protein RJ640_023809 [Escallonia rubra]KAK2980485.1 hypothetical protein RJ640_023811 [Escallonia rubra]
MEIPLSTASRPPTGSLRGAFPEGFMFGTSTSAFQIEGATTEKESGRKPSVWDTFAKEEELHGWEKATDHYHRYKSEPTHNLETMTNLMNRKDFEDYADFCFRTYGDRVKHWITICGPWSYAYSGYGVGTYAPGRGYSLSENQQLLEMSVFPASGPFSLLRLNTKPSFDLDLGDPGREPYVVAKTLLLAHAAAVRLYRRKYKIGIILQQVWPIPYSRKDEAAAQRAKDFMLGWFMEPLISGDYPKSMKALVGCRLPKFTRQESRMIKGTYDFIALNYYTANYAMNAPDPSHGKPHVARDSQVISLRKFELDHESSSIHVYPEGLLDYLLYVKNKYNDPKIYISENGIDQYDDPESPLPLWEALSDYKRVYYYNKHLSILKTAIDKYDVKVKGYFTWSLLDNFEWNSGLPPRFGHFYVDYSDNFKRYPKLSAEWFKTHLRKPLPFPPSWTPDKK